MPSYRVTTPDTPRTLGRLYADFEHGLSCTRIAAVGDLIRPFGFDGCTVWKRNRTSHWEIIFDTSTPDPGRLPPSLLWLNVVQNAR